jgi:hypothetical protein
MAEKYRPQTEEEKKHESFPTKVLKLGAGILAVALGIDLLRRN